MSYPAKVDSSIRNYDDYGAGRTAATARGPDAANWHAAIVAASSPDCCTRYRTAMAMPFVRIDILAVVVLNLYR